MGGPEAGGTYSRSCGDSSVRRSIPIGVLPEDIMIVLLMMVQYAHPANHKELAGYLYRQRAVQFLGTIGLNQVLKLAIDRSLI
jgi:hypothetical protein